MLNTLLLHVGLIFSASYAYSVPLKREMDPLNPETSYTRSLMGGFEESLPLEYYSPVVSSAGYGAPIQDFLPVRLLEPIWFPNPSVFENPSLEPAEVEEDLSPMNLVQIEAELSASLDSMTPQELDEFSDWLVAEGNEKYLETFLGILESQLIRQYNQNLSEEQEIADVLTDIEMLESELNEAEELEQNPTAANYLENYNDELTAPATHWVYPQPAFEFVEPVAMQNTPSIPAFLSREVDPEMKRYVLG